MTEILHNDVRELLVEGYKKSYDAAGIAQAYEDKYSYIFAGSTS